MAAVARREPRRRGHVFAPPPPGPRSSNLKWKVEVGTGYAAPITVGDRVFAFSRQGEDEVMRALDAATGKTMWETKYNATYKPNPAATRTHGTGPKSTPTFADGRLYTLGMSGIVTAFDAASGKQLWQKPRPAIEPLYHTAMSPLVDRGLVIVHVGGHNDGALTAFDARTGDVKWSWNGDGPAYGSPIVAELGGTRQVITMTQDNLVGVSAATGELLWKRPYTVRSTRNAVTPIIHNQIVIVSGLGMPVIGFRVINKAGQWTSEDVWTNNDVTHGHEHRRGDRQQPVRLLAAQQRPVLRDRCEHRPDAVAVGAAHGRERRRGARRRSLVRARHRSRAVGRARQPEADGGR